MPELTVKSVQERRKALLLERMQLRSKFNGLKQQIAKLTAQGQAVANQMNANTGAIETLDALLGAVDGAAEAEPEPATPAATEAAGA